MPAMAAPLAADKLEAWEGLVGELNGPKKDGFDDMNSRHGLEEHRAYLQPMPDGNYLVLVVVEGPGADDFLGGVAASGEEFDQWFTQAISDLHGMDPGVQPPTAERKI